MDFRDFLQRRESSEITRFPRYKVLARCGKVDSAVDFGWQFWVAQRFSAAITDLVLNGGFSR
jgi:hypothetical protein